jgi:uncharacterized protein
VILVDSNIPMYVVGAGHPNKERAVAALQQAITDGEPLVTDAEVLQEILHRYVAINRRDAIGPATDALLAVVDEVYPIEREDVDRARRIVAVTALSARDVIHVAVMRRRGLTRIMSFDRGFDAVDGIERIG